MQCGTHQSCRSSVYLNSRYSVASLSFLHPTHPTPVNSRHGLLLLGSGCNSSCDNADTRTTAAWQTLA